MAGGKRPAARRQQCTSCWPLRAQSCPKACNLQLASSLEQSYDEPHKSAGCHARRAVAAAELDVQDNFLLHEAANALKDMPMLLEVAASSLM